MLKTYLINILLIYLKTDSSLIDFVLFYCGIIFSFKILRYVLFNDKKAEPWTTSNDLSRFNQGLKQS